MPLHLLGKKSWNVYNADNIERVRRDEAIAAAHEEEVDRLMQEHDAAKRTAILRGLPPPPTPSPPPPPVFNRHSDKPILESKGSGRERKNSKLAGEDDTDRDIRLARIQREDAAASKDALTEKPSDKKKALSHVPLYDEKGHINLFATDEKEAMKAQKEADVKAEKLKKKQEAEEQFSMRFSDAAGRAGAKKCPWYVSSETTTKGDTAALTSFEPESKNVWGRPDPNRKLRDERRITSSDPLAFMKKAQVQLKESERDRKMWAEERARELDGLRSTSTKSRDGRRRRGRSVDNDSLEDFSLDGPTLRTEGSEKGKHRHRKHRRRSRSRSPGHRKTDNDRERDHSRRSSYRHRSHHRERSRSRIREREHRPRSRYID